MLRAVSFISSQEARWPRSFMRDNMLITLCYVYLWVRFHKCYSVLIRNSLCRLNSSSFSFSLCAGSGSSSASTPSAVLPGELHAAAPTRSSSPQLEDNIFLQLGDKAVYVTEPQVGSRTCFGWITPHLLSVVPGHLPALSQLHQRRLKRTVSCRYELWQQLPLQRCMLGSLRQHVRFDSRNILHRWRPADFVHQHKNGPPSLWTPSCTDFRNSFLVLLLCSVAFLCVCSCNSFSAFLTFSCMKASRVHCFSV